MTDEQRLQALEAYNPHEHLVKIKAKDGTLKDYLPAGWRLYELRLRYPNITIESEIVHLDAERNLVVVKAWMFDGKTYAESERRASAYKQGFLSALDKVETAAKARASRDFGISTELALDMDDDQGTPSLGTIKTEVRKLKLVSTPEQWYTWKKAALGDDIPDEQLTPTHLQMLLGHIEQMRQRKTA